MMPRSTHQKFGISSVAVATCIATSVMLACGGEPSAGRENAAEAAARVASCRRGDTTAAYVAYREFIKATVPTPQRFLTAAGTDSAASEDGFRAMQDKGPSYFYGGDSTAQRQIREKLASVGPYASLLIVQRSSSTSKANDTLTVELGGHYIGGELDGTSATSKSIVVACGDSAWTMLTIEDVGTP